MEKPSPAPWFPSWPVLQLGLFLLFAAFQLARLDHPDVHMEECFQVRGAMNFVHGMTYERCFLTVPVGGRDLPLLEQDHLGAVTDWLAIPVFALFGVNYVALRLLQLCVALFAAWLAGLAVRRLAGRRAETIFLVLFLFHSGFFYFARRSFVGCTSVQWIFTALAALAFVGWKKDGKPAQAFGWGFVLGVGVYAKLLMFWQVLGYGVQWLSLAASRKFRMNERSFALWGLGLALSPFHILNWYFGWRLVTFQFDKVRDLAGLRPLAQPSPVGFVIARFRATAWALTDASRAFTDHGLNPWLAAVALLYVAILWRYARARETPDPAATVVRAWLIVCGVYWLGLLMPVTGPGPDHILPVLPLFFMALAVAVDRLFASTRLAALLLLLSLGQWFSIARCTDVFGNGMSHISDALLVRGIRAPWVTNNGDALEACLLTFGRVRPRSLQGRGDFDAALADPDAWFMGWCEHATEIEKGWRERRFWDILQDRLAAESRVIVDRQYLLRRDGVPAYQLFRVSPPREIPAGDGLGR